MSEELANNAFWQLPLAAYEVRQVTPATVLHYQVDVGVVPLQSSTFTYNYMYNILTNNLKVQFPAPARVFMFDFFVSCCVFFCQKNYFNIFFNINLFSILYILQDL